MNAYQQFCKKLLMPIGDRVVGLNVSKRFKEIEKFQWMDRDYIDKYQLEQFTKLIRYIYEKVKYYREYFEKNKLKPEDFNKLSDIERLPIINKEILRENFNGLKAKNFKRKIFEMRSSGSTGQQSTVLIDKEITTDVLATQLLFWSWGDFFMGAPHFQTGMSLQRGYLKQIKDYLFRCYYTSAFGLTDEEVKKSVELMKRKNVKYIFGYASSVYVIAMYLEKRNIQLDMKKIFTWGDCLFPHYRAKIEKALNANIVDCYGIGEGLQVAAQCEQNEHLHIAEHHVLVEIIDEKSENKLMHGKCGRVIVTRFDAGPMPLLRYDTGDISSINSGKCKCGRKLKLLTRVLGRDTDIVISPKGDRLIVHFFTQLFEMIPQIEQFQVIQNSLEELRISYVPGKGFSNDILKKIEEQINDKCKYKFNINFKEVLDIPLEKSNKRRFVISNVGLG